jgi:hypothetical protein
MFTALNAVTTWVLETSATLILLIFPMLFRGPAAVFALEQTAPLIDEIVSTNLHRDPP